MIEPSPSLRRPPSVLPARGEVFFATCTKIARMDKRQEIKERILVPLCAISVIFMSIIALLLVLYVLTILIRFLFALG